MKKIPKRVIEVRGIVDRIEYHCPEPYQIHSAKETIKRMKGHCLEASMAAAYLMEPQGFAPDVMIFYARSRDTKKIVGHAIYPYSIENYFYGLGKSRHQMLGSVSTPKESLNQLMEHYEHQFGELGYDTICHVPMNLDSICDDWRDSERCLDEMDEFFLEYAHSKGFNN